MNFLAVMMEHVYLQANIVTSERNAMTDQMKNRVQQNVTLKRTNAAGGMTS